MISFSEWYETPFIKQFGNSLSLNQYFGIDLFVQSIKIALNFERAELWGASYPKFATFIRYLGGFGEGWGGANPGINGSGGAVSLCPGKC